MELEQAIRTRRTHKAAGERVLGLVHLGSPRQAREPPAQVPTGDFVTFLP